MRTFCSILTHFLFADWYIESKPNILAPYLFRLIFQVHRTSTLWTRPKVIVNQISFHELDDFHHLGGRKRTDEYMAFAVLTHNRPSSMANMPIKSATIPFFTIFLYLCVCVCVLESRLFTEIGITIAARAHRPFVANHPFRPVRAIVLTHHQVIRHRLFFH